MTRASATVLAILVGALAVLGTAGPASARDDAAVSSPPDGATLPAPPAEVTLTVTRDPIVTKSRLVVLGPDGRTVSRSGTPAGTGRRLTQGVSTAQTGVFTIAYRVVFADGGREEGVRRFTVGAAGHAHDAAGRPGHAHSIDPVSAALLVVDGGVALTVVILLMTRRPRSAPVAWRLHAYDSPVLEDTERNRDDRTA